MSIATTNEPLTKRCAKQCRFTYEKDSLAGLEGYVPKLQEKFVVVAVDKSESLPVQFVEEVNCLTPEYQMFRLPVRFFHPQERNGRVTYECAIVWRGERPESEVGRG